MLLIQLDKLDFFGYTVDPVFTPLVVFIFVYFFLWAFKKFVVLKLKKIAEKTSTKLDDLLIESVEKIGLPFYFFVSFFIAVQFVSLPDFFYRVFEAMAMVAVIYYAVTFLQKLLAFFTEKYIRKNEVAKKHDPAIIFLLSKIFSYFLWVLAVLLAVANAGYDVSALLAGLGIFGIAVALAVQNILSDVFSSLSIYFDKPFKVGDFIILGQDMGVVQKIGIKTTRVQALQGEEIVFSNRELTESRIHNFGKMSKRRVEFRFGIEYGTPLEKIKKVKALVKESIAKANGAALDRVHFKSFGDFSLVFEVVYYIPTGDYNAYMDGQETINHSLVQLFKANKIEFAFPTQKILLSK